MSKHSYPFVTILSAILCFPAQAIAAGPVVTYAARSGGVRLIPKSAVDEKLDSRFVVEAEGRVAVVKAYAAVAGVLLQATAQPDDRLASLPIQLSYELQGDHDAVLNVGIGRRQGSVEAPAWVWAVAAQFADHPGTAAVTLLDQPQSRAERSYARRWYGKNGLKERLLWSRYHPAVDGTLMGFFLLAADAMAGDPEHICSITKGLKGFDRYCGYTLSIDSRRSGRAARALDMLISLEARAGDRAMLNDVGETLAFSITDGKLQTSGGPNYHFARKTRAGEFQEIAKLTRISRQNRRLWFESNPLVHTVVSDFAQLVAFFNYIDATHPDELDAFVSTLPPVLDRIPTMETQIALPLPAR